jgi:hypothetical protein
MPRDAVQDAQPPIRLPQGVLREPALGDVAEVAATTFLSLIMEKKEDEDVKCFLS